MAGTTLRSIFDELNEDGREWVNLQIELRDTETVLPGESEARL